MRVVGEVETVHGWEEGITVVSQAAGSKIRHATGKEGRDLTDIFLLMTPESSQTWQPANQRVHRSAQDVAPLTEVPPEVNDSCSDRAKGRKRRGERQKFRR